MESTVCPCGSGMPFGDCCEPLISGKPAPTAEALMRSRYTAYVRGDIDYLESTLAPESRHDFDKQSAGDWSQRSEWLQLEILDTEGGKAGDAEGQVEFRAHYIFDKNRLTHHERSSFRFDSEDGRWYFVEAVSFKNAPVVKVATPGRNDPCSCGSGKKYKKCCAAA